MRDLRGPTPSGEQIDDQLRRWIDGESVHLGDKESGTCCPDFSCCQPELLADPVIRRAFVLADDVARRGFLGGFLGAAINLAARQRRLEGKSVAIVAGDPEESA